MVKYRQTLTGLAERLAGGPVAASVGALDTPAGAASLETAFTVAYGALAPATRARHLAAALGPGMVAHRRLVDQRPDPRLGPAQDQSR